MKPLKDSATDEEKAAREAKLVEVKPKVIIISRVAGAGGHSYTQNICKINFLPTHYPRKLIRTIMLILSSGRPLQRLVIFPNFVP